MDNLQINWIIEISDYEVEDNLKIKIDQILRENRQILNFGKLDIILMPFNMSSKFENILKKHISYFFNPKDLNFITFNEDAFALYVPDNLLVDPDLCLIIAKVYKYMSVSILHELYHKFFENNNFKRKFMPKSYLNEGIHFNTYLEDFFVEFLAIESSSTNIFSDKSNIEEYIELNKITERDITEKTLQIYQGFKAHGGNDFKGLIISLLSCYYIFFSIWRKSLEMKLGFEEYFKELWNTILSLKEFNFFKKVLKTMQQIFIEEKLGFISNKMQILFNSL